MQAELGWSKFVRFADEQGAVLYGEPIEDGGDSELELLALKGTLTARLIKPGAGGILSPGNETTNEIRPVHRLLGPLSIADVPEIKCIGLNYRKHILEAGRAVPANPSLFVKPSTAITGPGSEVSIPKCAQDGEADYEGELCVIIGRDCKNVDRESALEYVAGYTCGNDISSRKWQRFPGRVGNVPQWCFSKGFDTFAPLGPCVISKELIPDPSVLNLTVKVNGELRQETSTGDLIFDIPHLIAFVSQGTTLRKGTVIMTGTPGGVGCAGPEEKWRPLRHDDEVTVAISKIGVLRNKIVYE